MGHFYSDLGPRARWVFLTFSTMMKCCNEIKWALEYLMCLKKTLTFGPKLGYSYSNLSKSLFMFSESYSKDFLEILQEWWDIKHKQKYQINKSSNKEYLEKKFIELNLILFYSNLSPKAFILCCQNPL